MAQTIEVKPIEDQHIWEAFIDSQDDANFLQSWMWGHFYERLGNKVVRYGFYQGNKIVGAFQGVIEDARRGRYLAIGGGPLLEWGDDELEKEFISTLKKVCIENKCVFARIRPQIHNTEENLAHFARLGLVPSPMHLHAELTSQIDLTQTEEEIMTAMRKKTRYEVRQADKKNVKVLATDDPSTIQEFYDLQMDTAKRHDFVPFSYEYLYEQFKTFAKSGNALLFRAEHEGQLLAEAFVIFYGKEAAYHYGASTLAGRDFPGAYAIQWAAMKEAKKRGIARYNLWGITEEDEKDHRFYGVSVFKRGFGGTDVHYLHAHDLVINKPKYLVNKIVEVARKKLRKV